MISTNRSEKVILYKGDKHTDLFLSRTETYSSECCTANNLADAKFKSNLF